MRYLVTTTDEPPFFTMCFDYENHWAYGIGMIVYDLFDSLYTSNGITWNPIETDEL